MGNFTDDYKMMYCKDPEQPFKYGGTGCLMSILSSRLSWFFNLSGQSLSLDSACSSSLTAVDIACQNLLNRDSNMVKFTVVSFVGNTCTDIVNIRTQANIVIRA